MPQLVARQMYIREVLGSDSNPETNYDDFCGFPQSL